MIGKRYFFKSSILILFAFFFGCGESAPPVASKPAPSTAATVVPKPPAEEIVASEAPVKKEDPVALFQYNPEGRRDPFKSIIIATGKRSASENLPPLQRKELSEMKLIGIVWGGFGHGAIIQTQDGKGYPVRKGTRIGLNNGVINQITNKEVVIEEKYLDIFGDTKVRNVVMELHPQKEGLE
jgi:type IV pilus assembly protein PilP